MFADEIYDQILYGSGPRPDHFRIVTLPPADDLDAAIVRIGRFLTGYRQGPP